MLFKDYYQKSLEKVVKEMDPGKLDSDVDRFVIRLKRLGFNKHQQVKMLKILRKAIDKKVALYNKERNQNSND